jgi:hypothetical protein
LSKVRNKADCPRIACLHDDAEQGLGMSHAMLNGIDVTLRWSAFVAGACGQTWVNMCEGGPSRIVNKPAKVQTVTYVSTGEQLG